MLKRGQTALFMILGIIVLIIIGLVFLFRSEAFTSLYKEQVQADANTQAQLKNLNSFVEKCVENTAYDGVKFIGQNGGYVNSPNLSYNDIPYYFFNNKSYFPSKSIIQNEINKYVNDQLFFCTRNFIDFPDLVIFQEIPKTSSKINDNEIELKVNYPLRVFKNNIEYNTKVFNAVIDVRLGIIHNTISEIMVDQLNNTDSICVSCIVDLSEKNDLKVNIENMDDKTMLFIIRDENSRINNQSYEFIFVNEYD